MLITNRIHQAEYDEIFQIKYVINALDNLPDMFVGDMTVTGHIGAGECRSTAGYALEYPNPGEANTIVEMSSNGDKCFTKVIVNKSTTLRWLWLVFRFLSIKSK